MEMLKGCFMFMALVALVFFALLLLECVVLFAVCIWDEYFSGRWRRK